MNLTNITEIIRGIDPKNHILNIISIIIMTYIAIELGIEIWKHRRKKNEQNNLRHRKSQ